MTDDTQTPDDVREAVARALWLHANTDREGDLPDYEPDEDDMRWFSVAADAALSAIPKPRVSAEQVERRLIGEWHEGQCACREFDGDDLDSCASTPRFRMVAPMAWTVEDVLRAAGIEVAE